MLIASLIIHDDAKADLLALRRSEPRTAGRVLALLEQLEDDPDLLDRLTQHHYGSADFHVSRWQTQWRKGRNLWRIEDVGPGGKRSALSHHLRLRAKNTPLPCIGDCATGVRL